MTYGATNSYLPITQPFHWRFSGMELSPPGVRKLVKLGAQETERQQGARETRVAQHRHAFVEQLTAANKEVRARGYP